MARSTLARFRQGDQNTIALFNAINGNLQRGLNAQAAVNDQVIEMSTRIRTFANLDRDFKFRLSNELHNRKREGFLDKIRMAEFNQRSTLANAEIAQFQSNSIRKRAQSAALSGNLEESQRLHTKADEVESSIFSGLELHSFTLDDLQQGIKDEGDDGILRGMVEELGIKLPGQPTNELNGEGVSSDPNVTPDGTLLFPEDGDQEGVAQDATEPTPAEKLNLLKGGKAPERPLSGFDSITTQEDLDEFIRLAGIEPSTREGQSILDRVIPQTTFGKEQKKQQGIARRGYLNQALAGGTGDTETAIKYFQEDLGGNRATYEAATRIGADYRDKLESFKKASLALIEAEDAVPAAMFRANKVGEDPTKVTAGSIKSSDDRAALARASTQLKAAKRAATLAEVQLQAAEREYVQFQIDQGLMSEEDIEKLREAQDEIETIDQAPLPEPPEEVINEGGAEIRLGDFKKDAAAIIASQLTGIETTEELRKMQRREAGTSAALKIPEDFGVFIDTAPLLEAAKDANEKEMAFSRIKSISRLEEGEGAEEVFSIRRINPNDKLFKNEPDSFSITFSGDNEKTREGAKVAREYINSQREAFNSLGGMTKRRIINDAYNMLTSGPDRTTVRSQADNYIRSLVGIKRNNLPDASDIGGDGLPFALAITALTEAEAVKDDIKRLNEDDIDFDAIRKTRQLEGVRENQPINESPEIEAPDLKTAEEVASETGLDPDTIRTLRLEEPDAKSVANELSNNLTELQSQQMPDIKGQEFDGGAEEDLESTVIESDKLSEGESKKAKKIVEAKAKGIVANGTKPEPFGRYGVILKTRDQIENFDDLRKQRNVISLDFNHDGRKSSVSRALIVIPNDASEELVKAAQSYVRLMSKEYGIKLAGGGKHGNGVRTRSENGRGLTRVTHLEGFYGNDDTTVASIRRDPNKYANILKLTFGKLNTAVFIPPHTQSNGGAATNDGVFERDFALKHILPLLKSSNSNS